MTQLKSYLLWQGRLVSLQFPYLQALFQQRPRHRMDEFEFQHPPMEREKRAKIFAPFLLSNAIRLNYFTTLTVLVVPSV